MGSPPRLRKVLFAECSQGINVNVCHNHPDEVPAPHRNHRSQSLAPCRYSFQINVLDFTPPKSLEPHPLNFRGSA